MNSLPSLHLESVGESGSTSMLSLIDCTSFPRSIHQEYTLGLLRRFLENLHEVRAVQGSYHNASTDDPARSALRETLLCMLWDVEKAMRHLSRPLREALYWHYVQALPEREAAARLGLSRSALRGRVRRAEGHILDFLIRDAPVRTTPCREVEGCR